MMTTSKPALLSLLCASLLATTAVTAQASDWQYQGDDFIVYKQADKIKVTDMQPLPGLMFGLANFGDMAFSSLQNAVLVSDDNTSYFLSDDEVVVMRGDGEHTLLLPNMPNTLQTHYLAKPDIRVLANNTKVRAVAENRRYFLVADFITPSSAGYISAKTPLLVSTQHQLGNMAINVAVKDKAQTQVQFKLHASDVDFMDTEKLNRFMRRGVDTMLSDIIHVDDPESRVSLVKQGEGLMVTVDMKGLRTPSYSFKLMTDY